MNVHFALKNKKNMRFGDAIWRRFKSDAMSVIFIGLGFFVKEMGRNAFSGWIKGKEQIAMRGMD